MDTINTAEPTTIPVQDEPVQYQDEAVKIASIFHPLIANHKTPIENGSVPQIQVILGSNVALLQGLFSGTLFDTGETAEEKEVRLNKLAELESSMAAIRKQLEILNDEKSKLTMDETPKQEAVREFLQAASVAYLNPTNYVSTRLASFYEAFGMEKPEPSVKRGAKKKEEASTNGAAPNSDLVHVSKHAEGAHD